MSGLVDLTLVVPGKENGHDTVMLKERVITSSSGASYTGMVYDFHFGSMAGTYIDFPGHIKETDDGIDAANYPVEELFRVDAAVIHLDRKSGSGGISADELKDACDQAGNGSALIINALGKLRFDDVEERSIFLEEEAVQWIINTGIHLLVSDVYESKAIHGVFHDLFAAGISTVCCPVNLDKLTVPRVRLSVFYLLIPGVTQVPCRVIAEVGD